MKINDISRKRTILSVKGFITNLVVTTKQKSRIDTKHKKLKKQKKIIESHQIKMADRNTRTNKQWRY